MGELICPRCDSTRVKPSRSRGPEHVLKIVNLRAYRCINCGCRMILRSGKSVRRGTKAVTYTHARLWMAALITALVLIALFYWMMREPEKPPIPVETGFVLILGRKRKDYSPQRHGGHRGKREKEREDIFFACGPLTRRQKLKLSVISVSLW